MASSFLKQTQIMQQIIYMKKIYTILSLFAVGSFFFNSVSGVEVPVVSYTLYDLTHEQLNKVHTDSEGNQMTFSTNEPAIQASNGEFRYLMDIDNPLIGFNETPSEPPLEGAAFYTKAILQGKSAVNIVARAPYIDIALAEDHTLTEIQISGYGSSVNEQSYSDLVCAFSTSGANTNDFNTDGTDMFYISGTKFENPRLPIPEGTKYIRLISHKNFGGWGVSEFDSPIHLYAMRFYVMKNGSGVEETVNSSYDMQQSGSVLSFAEISTVSVYSISGASMFRVSGTNQVDLSHLLGGVYIVKASSMGGEVSLTRKIIVR